MTAIKILGYIVKNKTENGYRCGYINHKWKKILNTEYISVSRILDITSDDVYLIASKNGQYGVIKNKKEGKQVASLLFITSQML